MLSAHVLSCVQLFATPWTVAPEAPLVMGISRQEYWSGQPFPTPEYLPNPGIEPASPVFPVLARRFFTTVPPDFCLRWCENVMKCMGNHCHMLNFHCKVVYSDYHCWLDSGAIYLWYDMVVT